MRPSCIHWLICHALVLLAGIGQMAGGGSAAMGADEAALRLSGRDRVVFVGDSITGLGQNSPDGFVHLIGEAMKKASGEAPTLVALGGSGQGVASWGGVESGSRQKESFLDVKGVGVKSTLDGGADVLVIMLGMNDVLAPYVGPDPQSLDQWTSQYRQLVQSLKTRTKARVVALAGITPCTEGRQSPRNLLIRQLNDRARALAKELGCRWLPTNQSVFDLLDRGRKINADFHITRDYVHPNEAGHLGIAIAMLRGLDQAAAADHLETRVTALLAKTPKTAAAPKAPPAWLVGTGLVQMWNGDGGTFDPVASRTAVDEAIEKGQDFTGPIEVARGKVLTWQRVVPSVDFVGGAAPGSIDFTAVAVGQNFEGAYAARWIHCDRARAVQLELSMQTFAGDHYLSVWLNGKSAYQGLINAAPGLRAVASVDLRQGWNVLVLKSNHRTWQWQCAATLLPQQGDDLADLRYESRLPSNSPATTVPSSSFVQPALRYHLDQPAQVTLVIDDAQGQRVRNLLAAGARPTGDHEETWDGLDDRGQAAKAGEYRWRGIVHGPITSHFQGAFNSPGNPPWVTLRPVEWYLRAGTNGGWLSDHAAPLCSYADGDRIFLGAEIAEAGHSIIQVDPTGQKQLGILWLSQGCANILSAEGDVLYAASEKAWMGDYIAVSRFDLKTRGHVPNPPALKQVRADATFIKEKRDDFNGVKGMVLTPQAIVLSLADRNRLAFFGRDDAKHFKDIPLPQAGAIVKTPAGAFLGISGRQIVRLDLEKGAHQPLITDHLEQPSGLTVAKDGTIYVTDLAPAEQCIKVFSATGKFQRLIGKPGGRHEGEFDPQAMSSPTSISIDGRGQLWVTEHDQLPKRVSVWGSDGRLIRDMIGGPSYGGGGAVDPLDSSRAYYQGMAFQWEKWPGTYRMTDLLFRIEDHLDLPLKMSGELVGHFPVERDGRMYLVQDSGPLMPGAFIGELRDHHLIPRAMVGTLGRLKAAWAKQHAEFVQQLPTPKGQGMFLWVDKNEDGRAEPAEVCVQADWDATALWSLRIGPDLSFHAVSSDVIMIISPLSDKGVLDYDLSKARRVPKPEIAMRYGISALAADLQGNLIVNCGQEAQQGDRDNYLFGLSPQGKILWTYPNPYPANWHASPRPRLGDIQHTLNVEGVAHVSDQAGDVFQLNGNKGFRYLFTTDGLFVAQLFGDARLSPWQQSLGEARFDMPMQDVSLGDECFFGWFGRGKDGRFLQVLGKDSSSVMEIKGLESIRRLPGDSIRLSAPAIAPTMRAGGQPPSVDVGVGEVNDAWMRAGVRSFPADQPVARFAMGASESELYLRINVTDDTPLVNSGDDPSTLFKTGDAVDFCFAIDPALSSSRLQPALGDVRILFTVHQGKPIAVRYRFVVPGTKLPVVFTSPAGRSTLDDVSILSHTRVEVKRQEHGYELLARIPWAELGLSRRPTGTLLGDVGVIFSDPSGSRNIARYYYYDQGSQTVSDLPAEAKVCPARWGPFRF